MTNYDSGFENRKNHWIQKSDKKMILISEERFKELLRIAKEFMNFCNLTEEELKNG